MRRTVSQKRKKKKKTINHTKQRLHFTFSIFLNVNFSPFTTTTYYTTLTRSSQSVLFCTKFTFGYFSFFCSYYFTWMFTSTMECYPHSSSLSHFFLSRHSLHILLCCLVLSHHSCSIYPYIQWRNIMTRNTFNNNPTTIPKQT